MSPIKNCSILVLVTTFGLFSIISSVSGQYNDFRCKCICPSPSVVTKKGENATAKTAGDKPDRSVYIGNNVHPHECNCDYVVLPQLAPDVQGKAKEFCPRCECRHESRNTTTIRWVVTLIIGVIVCLVIYMGFLMLLDPLLHKSRNRSQYEEQVDDTELNVHPEERDGSDSTLAVASSSATAAAGGSRPSDAKNVLNRVGQTQDKWKRKVKEQRENIYDKHTMLN